MSHCATWWTSELDIDLHREEPTLTDPQEPQLSSLPPGRAGGPGDAARLVDLARLSASGANLQPLKYILSCDRETNARIFPHTRWAGRWEWRVLRLAFTVLSSLEITQIAQPYLRALSTKCGETTNMAVGDGAEVVYVARNRTQQIISASAEGTPDADVFDVSATR